VTTPAFVPNPWPVVESCIICGHGQPTRELEVKFQKPASKAEAGTLVLRVCAKCYRKNARPK